MKIFISHSSSDADYGNALVDLLKGVGVRDNEIIFTSNIAYGIPIGKNIFDWLKTQINETPFVIYLLSNNYYNSVACLNEMGAAWIVENKHAVLFTHGFKIDCKEFQNGALDPREIGFYVDNEERLLQFIQLLQVDFDITNNSVIINQEVKKYLQKIKAIIPSCSPVMAITAETESGNSKETISSPPNVLPENQKKIPDNIYQKFLYEIREGKLKDDELILIQYIIDTANTKLGVGWREDGQKESIRNWELVNGLNNKLSNNYSGVVSRFQIRKYVEVSEYTSGNNPREVQLKPEIESQILYLPDNIVKIIGSVIDNNKSIARDPLNDLPF